MSQATAPNDDFAHLLKLAAAGDSEAQQALCEQYEQQVRIVTRVLLGPLLRPHLDSMDIMQSVHHSLLAGIRDARFDISSPDKLVALACTLVRRKVARKWRIHRRQLRNDLPNSNDSLEATLWSLSNHEEGPAKTAEYNDALQQLVSSFTDIEKTMLERRLEGYTTGEVAAELDMNPIAIRVRWTRLRQRLQAAGIIADWV